MPNIYDIAYRIGLVASSPYWLLKRSARIKVRGALQNRTGPFATRQGDAPAIWIHAVSLGEMNATRALIDELRRQRPELVFIVSTTTTTGYDRGTQLYGTSPHVMLIRYPLDLTSAINAALDALRPSVLVLMELEIWPNFILQCTRRKIPVMLANGRITPTSFRKYMRIRPITARMLRRLAVICVQDEIYAKRFIDMGAPSAIVQVTGTMKFDTAQIAERVEGDAELAKAVGLSPGSDTIWVCGSTGPGEEEIILTEYRSLRAQYDRLRLVIVPRHPERFDEVAALIERTGFNLSRRSQPATSITQRPVILGDTMGELRKFYSLADVVFVGRSLVDLGARQHGSDMIEPAALGKPVIVGRFTANFADAMEKLRQRSAIVELMNPVELCLAVERFISSPKDAKAMGQRAQDVVREQQGATAKHVERILSLIHPAP